MSEEIAPLDMVLPDKFIDFTRKRTGSFFGDGPVAHVSLADPVCSALRGVLAEAFADIRLHDGGTDVCIEGRRSRPASNRYAGLADARRAIAQQVWLAPLGVMDGLVVDDPEPDNATA